MPVSGHLAERDAPPPVFVEETDKATYPVDVIDVVAEVRCRAGRVYADAVEARIAVTRGTRHASRLAEKWSPRKMSVLDSCPLEPCPVPGTRRGSVRLGRSGPDVERFDDVAEPPPRLRQLVLDTRRARVEDVPLEHACGLELGQARCKRARRDPFERHLELVEADGAGFGGRPHDRERPAPAEEIDRAGDLLGQRPTVVTPHEDATGSARARDRALRRAS